MKIRLPLLSTLCLTAYLWLTGVSPVRADEPIYPDALAPSWQDWSYNQIQRNFAVTTPVHGGSKAIAVTYGGGWSGLQLGYSGSYLDITAYDTLRFWVHGGTTGGQPVLFRITLENNATIEKQFQPTANTWTQVDVPLTSTNSRKVYSVVWFNNSPNAQSPYYLDDIAFVKNGTTQPPPPTGVGPNLRIDTATINRRAISPYIYGMNLVSEEVAKAVQLPVRRWGGNSTSRYNWQLDVHNTGSDWFFQNIPDKIGTLDQFVDQDQRTGTKTILTMPLMGWTPKRRLENHPYDCGFKISAYGSQDNADWQWDSNCGNGMRGGKPITGNNPTDTSVAITPTFITSWINRLKTRYGTAGNKGVRFYNLDNEPMLWNQTHRDIHPAPTTYNELRDRTYQIAATIKAADPTAQILGPVLWGWCAYFYSAADGCQPGADRLAHGNLDFVPWYLDQMRLYEQKHPGIRLLDYLDLHIYPQVDGVFSDNPGNADVQALRLRLTRQLWDKNYIHEGWIQKPVYLIPRMKQWVTERYPGTKLAITEYNWGAFGFMNGALAQADILGIFGREGLDLATLWPSTPNVNVNAPGIFAFRMYRNYDGTGKKFGETSVKAASDNQDKLSVYAALRSDGALTTIVINKTPNPLSSKLSLVGFNPTSTAQLYRYSQSNLNAIAREQDVAVQTGAISTTFPANSISLFVFTAKP